MRRLLNLGSRNTIHSHKVLMTQTISSGAIISYDDLGQGEPALLFMPSWCVNRTVFVDLVARCSQKRRVFALDWRGHGRSGAATGDFGFEGLVEDARAVIEASGAQQVVPVAFSESGWVAIELRRGLGDRIPRIVCLDWNILEAPVSLTQTLEALQSSEHWEHTREQIFTEWLQGATSLSLIRFVNEQMQAYGFEMWARAARETNAAYLRAGSPLQALSDLQPPVPVLHLYGQPDDPKYWASQKSFADAQGWFRIHKLAAISHFPMLELPDTLALAMEDFMVN